MEVGEHGEITIPKFLRDELGLAPGTEVECELDGDRIVVTKVRALSRAERMRRRRTVMTDEEAAAAVD